MTSLQVENQALQAALERLRLDFQEERSLRLQSGPAAAAATAAASKVRPSTPSRLGIFRRRGLTSRHGGTPAAAAAAGEGGKVSSRREGVSRPPATPTRHNRLLSGPSFLNHHIRSTPGRSGSGGGMLAGGGGGSGAIAAAATPGGVGWSSVHGGIGSRHSTAAGTAGGSESRVQEGAGAQAAEGLPWVLNTDQVRAEMLRPADNGVFFFVTPDSSGVCLHACCDTRRCLELLRPTRRAVLAWHTCCRCECLEHSR